MMPTQVDALQGEAASDTPAKRGALAQLLHALNQPLTGLQCSMEVALARPRSSEHYGDVLRAGLELTERMRALVETIREVVDIEAEEVGQAETTELASLLREAVEDLTPVAEVKKVQIVLDCPFASALTGDCIRVTRKQTPLGRFIFRLLDSTLSMAALGTELRIESGRETTRVGLRICWQAEGPPAPFSRPELGLLIAQAWVEMVGGEWERAARDDDSEMLNVRLPRVS